MSDERKSGQNERAQLQDQMKTVVALHREGKLNSALRGYYEILEIDPDNADANHLAGLALLTRKNPGDLTLSLKYFRKAIKLNCAQSTYHNNLGNAYWNLGRIEEAADAFRLAKEMDPSFVQPRYNLGNCHWFLGRFEQARQSYTDALAANKAWAKARYMLANCEYTLGNTEAAIELFRDVISQRPDLDNAQLGLAHALLRAGRWQEGWRYFESRLAYSELALYTGSGLPQWPGCNIPGESLLVFAEQGIGDTLQFSRYLSLARPKVGKLGFVCDHRLHSLYSNLAEIDELLDRDKTEGRQVEANYDFRISLMSLPGLFQTTCDTGWEVPYIDVDKKKREIWKSRLFTSGKLKVGLVWAGNPVQKDDKYRSCTLKHLVPLFRFEHICFYSLQVGQAREEILTSGCSSIEDITGELKDFSDTAAVIDNLDLVITVDTAVAHLAGALGKPVWVMLWFSHCWRYLEKRTDSPWYPTMRLFRQKKIGEWEFVVDQISAVLERMEFT